MTDLILSPSPPVGVESAVSPRPHLLDKCVFDPAFVQKQTKNLMLPEPKEWFVGEISDE